MRWQRLSFLVQGLELEPIASTDDTAFHTAFRDETISNVSAAFQGHTANDESLSFLSQTQRFAFLEYLNPIDLPNSCWVMHLG